MDEPKQRRDAADATAAQSRLATQIGGSIDPREFRPASANRRAALLLIAGLLVVIVALMIRAAIS